MKKDKISFITVVVILFSLLFFNVGNTESGDEWIWYGTTDLGDSYYDKSSMTKVSAKIIMVWNKDKYSKAGKDEIIQRRKNYNLSIDGYDKLDYVIDLLELDCVNMTVKDMSFIEYDNEDMILYEFEYPSPKKKHILPGTTTETLLKTVCP
jgi:hypothetical protein